MGYIDSFVGSGEPLKIHSWQLLHDITTGPHTLSCYLLIYIIKNQSLHIWNKRTHVIQEGDMMLIHPGQCHRYALPNKLLIYNCLFEKQMTSLSDPAGIPSQVAHIPVEERKRTVHLLRIIAERSKLGRASLSPEAIKAYLNELLVIYGRNIPEACTEKNESGNGCNYVLQAMNLIRQDSSLGISDISAVIDLNPDYLNRVFKKELNITLVKYKIMRRVIDAGDILERSDLSVGAIARGLGCRNISLFCAQFRKIYGKTPAEYRAYIRAGKNVSRII